MPLYVCSAPATWQTLPIGESPMRPAHVHSDAPSLP